MRGLRAQWSSMRVRLILGYVLVMLILALAWGVAAAASERMQASITDAVQARDALVTNVDTRIKLLDDEETALRGYLLTRQRSFLKPYTVSERRLPRLRHRTVRLAQGSTTLERLVLTMEAKAQRWEVWASAVLKHPPANPRQPAAVAGQDRGESLFDDFRASSSRVLQKVMRERNHDLARSRTIASRAMILITILFGIALALTVFIARRTIWAVVRPLVTLAEAARRIGSGNFDEPVPTGGLAEVDVLATSMDAMRGQLRDQYEHLTNLYARVQQSEEEYRLLAENSTDMIARLTPDGVVKYVSHACVKLLGYEPDDVVGHSAYEYFHPDDLATIRMSHMSNLEGTDTDTVTYRIRRSDGQFIWFETTSHAIHDAATGEVIEIQSTSRDTTKRKQMEEAVRASNSELEAFSYAVSHDLRAPLRSIDGFSQALLEMYGESLDERGKRFLGHVRGAAQDMGNLIDGLLVLSRVTRRDIERESVDLSALAQSTVDGLRGTDPNRAIGVTIADGLVGEGDPRLLGLVLENLIGNAWKFTRNTEDARIEFGIVTKDGVPAYYVRDNGAGFDTAYAAKLFTPFQRLHHASEFDGTGIGLATVHRVIRRHGGRVWAEGTVGEGAVFYFTLSQGQAAAA